jgi:LmbE family N-acetylglucosaminyl deacetylase
MVGQNHEHKEERPVAVYCFTQLIQPGKREDAKTIFKEIRGTRRSEYEVSRRRLGIREEKVWFQGLPQGDMAVVYWEGDDPRAALQEFASSDDTFDEWLKERGAGGLPL